MPTRHAQSQVYPRVTRTEAVLAPGRRGFHGLDLVEVRAGVSHPSSLGRVSKVDRLCDSGRGRRGGDRKVVRSPVDGVSTKKAPIPETSCTQYLPSTALTSPTSSGRCSSRSYRRGRGRVGHRSGVSGSSSTGSGGGSGPARRGVTYRPPTGHGRRCMACSAAGNAPGYGPRSCPACRPGRTRLV